MGHCEALILSGDNGVISSYPTAAMGWPVSQYERIWKVWMKVLNAASVNFPVIANTQPQLAIDDSNSGPCTASQFIACYLPSANTVHIGWNVAELMSDSDSELGFIIAHEIGHCIQRWSGRLAFSVTGGGPRV
jgi:hypothetical protein